MKTLMLVALAALSLVSLALAQPTVSIEWIDANDYPYGAPVALTNDGSTFVARDELTGNSLLWERGVGLMGVANGLASDIADNGMIIGDAYLPYDNFPELVRQAAYYQGGGVWVALDGFPVQPEQADWYTHAYSISRQTGEKIVGMYWVDPGTVAAYEWTFTDGFNQLQSGLGVDSYKAMFQSGDGSIVAGWDQQTNGCRTAWMWNPDPVFLGSFCDDPTWPHGEVGAISDNGEYIAGASITGLDGYEMFVWTEADSMQLVGTLPGYWGSWANGVSDDGQVIGWAQDTWGPWGNKYAAIGDLDNGAQLLKDYLNDMGADIGDNMYLTNATDISADGRYILGTAQDLDWNIYWFIAEIDNGDPEPVSVTLTPANTTIPAAGGTLSYDVHLLSTIGASYNNVQFWTDVVLPNGSTYGPLFTHTFNLTPFMDHTATGLTQDIPVFAPAGDYSFQGHVGYPNGPSIMGSFGFTKEADALAIGGQGPSDWTSDGNWIAADSDEFAGAVPNEFAIARIAPNPFNPVAEITVTLPATSELNVVVVNTAGQQVASLADGSFQAGQHRFSFDGSALASGLYFVRASIPGQQAAVQKMTLLK